jgi:hypothetical protein
VVGPLIEVPVMLALVWFARKTKYRLFEIRGRVKAATPLEAPVLLQPEAAGVSPEKR